MESVQEDDGEDLVGWYIGAKPRNMMQSYYSVLAETASQLSWSILEVESQFPRDDSSPARIP
jgi:hypothetical protein